MAASASPDAVRLHCSKILASQTFAESSRLQRFLDYVVGLTLEGKEDCIKEYAIGIDVFERPPDFDPKLDSIVRVQAGRPRLKLKEYYDQEGRDDDVRIEIPKRTYVPVFHLHHVDRPAAVPLVDTQRPPFPLKRLAVTLAAVAAPCSGQPGYTVTRGGRTA